MINQSKLPWKKKGKEKSKNRNKDICKNSRIKFQLIVVQKRFIQSAHNYVQKNEYFM